MLRKFKDKLSKKLTQTIINRYCAALKSAMAFQLPNKLAKTGLVVLLIMASLICAEQPPGISIFPHPLSKHSFTEISKCGGVYDMNIYAQFNQICLNCYNLYREPEIYRGCR